MLLKYFKKIFATIIPSFILVLPIFSLAAGTVTQIKNPIDSTDIVGLVNALINVAIYIGIPVATLSLVYAGFLYVSANGNQAQVTKAHGILQDILIGVAIILGAKGILLSIEATIRSLG